MLQILGRGPKKPPPRSVSRPKKPILNRVKLDEMSCKNILIYCIAYVIIKNLKYVTINSVNPLYLMLNEMNGYFEEVNGDKYLTLIPLIRSVSKKANDYDKKYIKIKFHSDDELPLNKTIAISVMIIVVRAILYENNKYCPHGFLDECLYEILNNIKVLYYDRIDVSEGIGVQKTSTSKTSDIFYYWCFLSYSFKFQPNVCNRCHDLLMMSMNLSDIAILNIKGYDYRCIISLNSKNETIDLMQNADLTEISGTL